MRKEFLRGSAWSIAERWGAKATTLATFVVLGRLLDPVDFGLVALALVLITLIHIFTNFGASDYLIQRPTLARSTCDTAFYATIALGVGLYALLFVVSPVLQSAFDSPGLAIVLRVFGLVLIISPFASIQAALLIRDLRFASMTARTLISTAVAAVVALSLAFNGYGVWALVGQQLTANLVSVAVLWRASTWRPGVQVDLQELRKILVYGTAISGTTLLNQIGTLSPSFLIGSALGPRTLGFYAVGVRLPTTFIELFANVLSSVSLPVFAKLKSDRARLAAAYRRAVVTGSALTTLMLLMLAALAPALIPLLFGDGWEPAIVVAQIGSAAAAFHTARCFDRNLRLALDGQRVDLVVSLVGCAALVAILVPLASHGLVPLLLGQLAAECIWWALSLFACTRMLGGGGLVLSLELGRNFALGLAAAGVAHVVLTAVDAPWLGVLLAGAAGSATWILLVTVTAPSVRDELWHTGRSVLRRRSA